MSHAVLSPSSAHRWMRCPASVAMCKDLPDEGSEHADEGTAAHFLAAFCLQQGKQAKEFVGRSILVGKNVTCFVSGENPEPKNGARVFYIDDDMAWAVQVYVTSVLEHADGAHLLVEERVEFGQHIGVLDQFGTADAIVLADQGRELQVHDLKFGRGVQVDAEDNEQLMLYALGALDVAQLLGDAPERVLLAIHQPRLGHLSTWATTVENLRAFAGYAKGQAQTAILWLSEPPAPSDLRPTEKGCRWCRARATCPALRDSVLGAVFGQAPASPDEFTDLTVPADGHINATAEEWLAASMHMADELERWCKSVRAEVERRLLLGQPIQGWKLVEGRKGARKWRDEAEAEALLKGMRLKHDQMYDYKLISPTSAEKLAKAEVIGPRQWPKVTSLITQAAGAPSVAPATDKRPALVVTPTADEFSDETAADLV